MIDVSTFRIERERLRRFCFRHTKAIVVILDIAGRLEDPRSSLAARIAEWLLFSLTIDAVRFADQDDGCDDLTPSVFAVPRAPMTKRDVDAALDANRGPMPFIVDYRVGEIMWPLISPQITADTLHQIKLWDGGLRRRGRLGGVVTTDNATDGIAIRCDGSSVLRRADGEKLDIGNGFWRAAAGEVAAQRCMQRADWQRNAFNTKGNA
jgi:hypothetical protein